MYLRRLEIRHLRCLSEVVIAPSPGVNVLAGANSSGKTSVLEGIYLLGTGRSFRSRTIREIVQRGAERVLVFGELVGEDDRAQGIGIERGAEMSRLRVAGEEVRTASRLARLLPLLAITPDSQRLLGEGARLRRRLLDWGLFHVEPQYHERLERYRRALRQRNAALRHGHAPAGALRAWGEELGALAAHLHLLRQSYVEGIRPHLEGLLDRLVAQAVEVRYQPGWDVERPLSEVLEATVESDRRRGYTAAGPHRADLRFLVGSTPARNALARGEGKLFVAALLLSQVAYVRRATTSVPVILVDDLPSELDAGNRARLLETLADLRAQTYLTAVSFDLVDVGDWQPYKMFHVEQGTVREVV